MSDMDSVTNTPQKVGVLKSHFIKSNHFRVVHADGVWGGITPSGYIQMAIFSQRTPIPQQSAQPILANGALGPEIEEMRIGKDGIVREVEIDVIMDLALAKSLRTWLDRKIEDLTEAQRTQKIPVK